MPCSEVMERINQAKYTTEPGLWQNVTRGFHKKINVFLCRTMLCFVADLMYMTCLDEAPLLTSIAREMHDTLNRTVVPTLREKRPDLGTDVTWDYCWHASVCLRDVFKKVNK